MKLLSRDRQEHLLRLVNIHASASSIEGMRVELEEKGDGLPALYAEWYDVLLRASQLFMVHELGAADDAVRQLIVRGAQCTEAGVREAVDDARRLIRLRG